MYTLDHAHECIRYTSARTVQPDEELCIFYGHKLRFGPVGTMQPLEPQIPLDWHAQSEFFDILALDNEADEAEPLGPGGPDDIMESDALPFIWKKLQIDEEEESIQDIRTSKFDAALQKLTV
jgi:tRNA-specific adenosine deaminase 3